MAPRSCGEAGKGRHVTNGVSAGTVRFLVLLTCVTTLMLLKCGWRCFYYGFPFFPPRLLIFRVSAPHFPLPPIIHYCHHHARMSLEGTLNGAVPVKEIQCD